MILEGTNLSKSTWIEFLNSDIWKALLFELNAREDYLIQLFKDNDIEWNPDVIRGKLTELDFFRQIPTLILSSIEDKDKTHKEIRDAESGG